MNNIPSVVEFDLTPGEIESGVWVKISGSLERKLGELHVALENPKLDGETTAVIRGRIAAIRDVLNLAKTRQSTRITGNGLVSRPPRTTPGAIT